MTLIDPSKVLLTPPPDFGVAASETEPLGYSEMVCYECSIEPVGLPPVLFQKSFTITANALDCSTSLVDAGFVDPPPILYNSAGSNMTLATDYL